MGMPSYPPDDRGSPSLMRLMSLLALIVPAGLAPVAVFEWESAAGRTDHRHGRNWRHQDCRVLVDQNLTAGQVLSRRAHHQSTHE